MSRIVVVTGGTRGIGRGIARAFAAHGAAVVVLGRSRQAAEAVAATLPSTRFMRDGSGGVLRHRGLACDVTDAAAVARVFADIRKSHDRVDVLVNAAGVNTDALLLRAGDGDIDAMLSTNLRGSIYTSRAAAKSMVRHRDGVVINIGSVVGARGPPRASRF
jgi:NAD(P)-dependent dehydrogenase (short-subunit alcohol dehydrogenase family)